MRTVVCSEKRFPHAVLVPAPLQSGEPDEAAGPAKVLETMECFKISGRRLTPVSSARIPRPVLFRGLARLLQPVTDSGHSIVQGPGARPAHTQRIPSAAELNRATIMTL